jgi:hypothetical protein
MSSELGTLSPFLDRLREAAAAGVKREKPPIFRLQAHRSRLSGQRQLLFYGRSGLQTIGKSVIYDTEAILEPETEINL